MSNLLFNNNTLEDHIITALAIGVAIFITVYLVMYFRKRSQESYGGPIKNVRKIPITDIADSCRIEFDICSRKYPNNWNVCSDRQLACYYSGYYSNYQRL